MPRKRAYENPLIPNVRMRALYRGLVETRALNKVLARAEQLPKGLDACWVATAMSLEAGDLTLDARTQALPDYLQSVASRAAAGPPRATMVRGVLESVAKIFAGNAYERLLYAAGMAAAMKAAGTGRVVVAYVRGDELAALDFKRFTKFAAVRDLPLIVVVAGAKPLPGAGPVPVIPVDASDAVAIYRVAQESVLRARAEGGLAVIECVRSGRDPVEQLAGQLLARSIATRGWLDAAEQQITRLLPE